MADTYTVHIYALADDGVRWYVGCTSDLTTRTRQHRARTSSPDAVKATITDDTRVEVLEVVTGTIAECRQAERKWIAHGSGREGWPLVNTTEGGEWHPHSAASRKAQSEASKRRWQQLEERERLSESLKSSEAHCEAVERLHHDPKARLKMRLALRERALAQPVDDSDPKARRRRLMREREAAALRKAVAALSD